MKLPKILISVWIRIPENLNKYYNKMIFQVFHYSRLSLKFDLKIKLKSIRLWNENIN